MDFDAAFDRLLGHEGGYVNDPRDPGGETRFGVSKRSYPGEDIRNLTVGRAKAIYLRDYWAPMHCDDLPEDVRFELFDMAVNMGVKTATKCLQAAVGAPEDGVVGPVTLRALATAHPAWLLRSIQARRLLAYTDTKAWDTFGRGWVRRVAKNMLEA